MQIKTSDEHIVNVHFQSKYLKDMHASDISNGRQIVPRRIPWSKFEINIWLRSRMALVLGGTEDEKERGYQSFVFQGLMISEFFICHLAYNHYRTLSRNTHNPYTLILLLSRNEIGLDLMQDVIAPQQLFTLEDKTIIPRGFVFKLFGITDTQGKSEAWWLEEMERRHQIDIPVWSLEYLTEHI